MRVQDVDELKGRLKHWCACIEKPGGGGVGLGCRGFFFWAEFVRWLGTGCVWPRRAASYLLMPVNLLIKNTVTHTRARTHAPQGRLHSLPVRLHGNGGALAAGAPVVSLQHLRQGSAASRRV